MKRLKFFIAACALLCAGQLWAQTTWSDDITNADGLAFTKQYVGLSDGDVAETWKTSIETTDGFDLNQSLTGVPDGVYELSAQAMYRASLTYGTPTNCVLYATVDETTFSTPIANFGDYTSKEDRTATGGIATQMQNNNAYLNVVPAVIVEGGNVTIGMKSIGELAYCTNGYWFVFKKSTFTFKNVTETYHAKLITRANTILASAPASDAKTTLSNAVTTYATANLTNVKALQAAINTFLETATVENPLNVTDYITNPSFNDDSGNKKNWIQDLGYKQPSDIYQPTGWNMLYSSAKVNNVQYQTYKTQTDNAKEGNCYYVRQRWGDVYAVVDLHQLVKELPSGAYRLTVAVKGGSSVTDANTLTMTAGSNTNTTTVNDFDKSNYKDYSVQVNKNNADEDLDISFGWNQQSGSEQLYYVDDFRLYYLGDPVNAKKAELLALQATIDDNYLNNAIYVNVVGTERTALSDAKTITASEETVAAYETAISDVQAAIDAFTAARTNYDANAAEVEKATALGVASATISTYTAGSSTTAETALTNTQALKVAEYGYVTTNYSHGVGLGEWTSTATNTSAADFTDEHWSGPDGTYKNQNDDNGQGWNASSWSINFSQNVALPAGNYVFKVAARQATGDKITTSLIVKQGDTTLGTVDDFPRGNRGLGINTSGATDFTIGDGHTYACNGEGYGWEWRYVKFTLSEGATVNIAVNAVATASHQWVSFGDYTLQTDNEANISLIAYNIALESAQTVIANDDYANVTGDEKNALQDAIDADVDKTNNAAIVAATTALNNAREAFVAAKDAYDTFVAAKAVDYENNLPYASSTKFAAIATAQGAADATSAADATDKTNAILSAYRKYVESNALAEGVGGIAIEIPDFRFADLTNDDINAANWKIGDNWLLDGQNNGSISFSTENSLTDGEGNNDYNFLRIQKNDNNAGIHQEINLEPGKYMMTVCARCQKGQGAKFEAFAGGVYVNIPQDDNENGQFGRGWNDVSVEFTINETSDVTFGVKSDWGKNIWWTVTRFRLVKLPTPEVTISESDTFVPTAQPFADVTLTRTLSASYWNTFSVPFDMAIPSGWEVKEFDSTTDNVINFTEATTIEAGKPYLVKPESNVVNPTYNGVAVVNTEGETMGDEGGCQFAAQIYNKELATDGTIAYLATDGTIKKLTSGSIKGLRAYFIIPAGNTDARIAFTDGDQTGIKDTVRETTNDSRVYDLQGREVKAVKKGIYVVNGKKVIK